MTFVQTLLSCAAQSVLCWAAAAASLLPAPQENETVYYGLAILQPDSVAPVKSSKGRVNYAVNYRVLAVIEQPAAGQRVPVGAVLESPAAPGSGRFVAPLVPRESISLERVCWRDGRLTSNARTTIHIAVADAGKEPPEIADYESKAYRTDVLKLRSAKDASAEAAALAAMAATTRTPSGSLIMEAERLREEKTLSLDARLALCRAMLALAVRPDAPRYVREGGLRRTEFASLHDDRQRMHEWHFRETSALLDAFHDWVDDPKRDVAYAETLLNTLESRLPRDWVTAAPGLSERFARFPLDLAAYEQRLARDGDQASVRAVKDLGARLMKMLPDRPTEKK